MRQSRRRHSQRGVSLLEGMIASVVLLMGMVGVFQGVIYASRQNAHANKMTRAGMYATQLRAALMSQGIARLNGAGGAFSACNNGLADLADGLGGVSGFTTCLVDASAYDRTAGAANKLTPGFQASEDELFKRVLVRMQDAGGKTIGAAVVVSWLELGVRKFHHQYVAFYDPSRFGGVDL